MTDNTPGSPPKKLGFDWAAFLWTWVWGFYHGQPMVAVGALVVNFVGLGIIASIFLGIYGSEIAFAANPQLTVEEYKRKNKNLLIAFAVVMALLVLLFCCFPMFLGFLGELG